MADTFRMTYIQPLLLVICAVLALGLRRVGTPAGRRAAWAGVVALFLISWPVADWVFSRPLEARYPARPPHWPGGIQAIVALGSAIDPPHGERPYPMPDRQTFERTEHAAWLHRQWGRLPVLACEGVLNSSGRSVMADLLQRAGVPGDLIWVETQSRSTHENAVFGAAILRRHGVRRIALVVDAASMPRAAACFRKEGIDVYPVPSEFRTLGRLEDELLPSWHAVERNEVTLHEIAGSVYYWLRGWI